MTVQGETQREQPPPGNAEVWAEILSDWPRRKFRKLHELVERLPQVSVVAIDSLFDETPAPTNAAANEVLRKAFAAAASPENRVLVALYLYAKCLETWELSTDYLRIRTVLRALETTAAELPAGAGAARDRESKLLKLVVEQAVAMDDSMAVESGVNCSCAVETGEKAGSVAGMMKGLLGRLEELGAAGDPRAEILRDDAEAQRGYFDAVSAMAAATEGLVDPSQRARPSVQEALGVVECAEADDDPRRDVYRSELRAHRAALAALHDVESRPRLHVEHAEFVYLYPFALEPFDPLRIDIRIHRLISLPNLCAKDLELHDLRLTDLWRRPARPGAESGYGGVSIWLPQVRVTTTARRAEDKELRFEAEVRLSRLGNHHLRVSSTLENASLHHVNQGLRRGSRSMGDEELASDGGRTWRRFTDYARDVVDAVAAELEAERIGDPEASFHIALAASEITVRELGKAPRAAKLCDLKKAVGASLLFRPVPGLATALEEWVRYEPPVVRDLLLDGGYEGELVARTANTSILYMPDSPDWRTAGYREMTEFVASVPPLLQLWEQQASDRAVELEDRLKWLTELLKKAKSRQVESAVLDDEVEKLHLNEADLRGFEGRITQQLGFIHSPALCRDRSQREFIDALWDAAGLGSLERELERRLAYLSALQERVSTIAEAIAAQLRREERQLAEKHASRIQTAVQYVGTFLAVVSVAELFSWLNAALDLKGWPWTVVEGALLAAVAVGVFSLLTWLPKAGEQ